MALEIEGKLIKKLPQQTGEGRNGPWVKQEFVLETFGEYPKKICFSTWNDRVRDIETYHEGSLLKITFSAESREYMERWYTDLRAFKIDPMGVTAHQTTASSHTTTHTQAANIHPPDPEPPSDDEQEGDDLPF